MTRPPLDLLKDAASREFAREADAAQDWASLQSRLAQGDVPAVDVPPAATAKALGSAALKKLVLVLAVGGGAVVGGVAAVGGGAPESPTLRTDVIESGAVPEPIVAPKPVRATDPVEPEPTRIPEPVPGLDRDPEPSIAPNRASTRARDRGTQPEGVDAEARMLRSAYQLMAKDDHAAALRALRRHRSRFRDGKLAVERDALEVAALCESGQRRRFEKARARFLKRWPQAVQVDRVKNACPDWR